MKLVFATNNQHKVEEMQAAIGDAFELVSLRQAGIDIDIPEPYDTLQENASTKSGTIYRQFHFNCFSEDTGLEVDALNGAPGVKSARYAGEDKACEKNVEKLLRELEGKAHRQARFRTVISLIIDGREYFFEGSCEGHIAKTPSGGGGFGYDPVFIPQGAQQSFAEMSLKEKELYSHRKKAADKLVAFLQSLAASQ
ncbi:MAG TPA: RdgB/HAM1 family non-canonical purine NTP pyrophosphatase [Chitinophagaceae bacterium]|nr:RdgB/HAM1 family non-canonical purine NTP pyrophosphatase [Chitinophagaceae bacterium]